jgi:hypothetical protein
MQKDLHKIKKIIGLAMVHVLPPFLLFYLVYQPESGAVIVIASGICTIVIIISAVSLLLKGSRYVYLKLKQPKLDAINRDDREYPKIKFLRPVLSIFISVMLIVYVQQFRDAAEEYLRQEANAIQLSCNKNNVCPFALEGWENKKGNSRKTHFINGTRFFLFYFVKEKTFEVFISYGFDSGYFMKGGVGQELKSFKPFH